jgi:hypothetical protein
MNKSPNQMSLDKHIDEIGSIRLPVESALQPIWASEDNFGFGIDKDGHWLIKPE